MTRIISSHNGRNLSDRPSQFGSPLGVARFIDASIYRDTFLAIRIAILFFTITIFCDLKKKLIFFFFFHNDFHLGRKDT